MFKPFPARYLVDGGSSQNTKYILSQIDAGLDTTLPDHYSPELADLINRLLSKKVRLICPDLPCVSSTSAYYPLSNLTRSYSRLRDRPLRR
jgi:hypothetical protein